MPSSIPSRSRRMPDLNKLSEAQHEYFNKHKNRAMVFFGIFLVGLALVFIEPLVYQMDQSTQVQTSRIPWLIGCNAVCAIAFAIIIWAAGSSLRFFRFKDKCLTILIMVNLALNFELCWEWNKDHYVGVMVLFAVALVPSISFASIVDKIINWILVFGYYGFVHYRIREQILLSLVVFNTMVAILLFAFLTRKDSEENLTKALNLDLFTQVFNASTSYANKVCLVLNKNNQICYANNAFYKFFQGNLKLIKNQKTDSTLFKSINRVACTENLVNLIGEQEIPSPRRTSIKLTRGKETDLTLLKKTSIRNTNFFKTLANDIQDDALPTILSLLFRYPGTFKRFNIGWDNEKNNSSLHNTIAYYEDQQLFLNFCYLNFYNEDFVLVEFTRDEGPKAFMPTPSNMSMTDVASIIHEIRTPLNGSMFLLQQALEDETIPLEAKKEFLIPSLSSSKRLKYIVNDILDLAQILEGKFRVVVETFDLSLAITEAVMIIEALAKPKGLQIYLEISPDTPPYITTDQNRLIQIIYNLMGNAVKFTNCGFVKLSVSVSRSSPHYIDFAVEDTGFGIKPEDIEKLFIAFEKLDNWNDNKVGSGLGLNIANSLAKTLGKKITVSSEYRKGSIFRFSIENQIKYVPGTGKTNVSLENTERPDLDGSVRKSIFCSFDESQVKKSMTSIVVDTQKGDSFVPRESNEISLEMPAKDVRNKTVHIDFTNLPSLHLPKRLEKDRASTYQIKIDPGVSDVKDSDNVLSFQEYMRLNSHQPLLSARSMTSGFGLSPRSSARSPQRFSCQCVKFVLVDDEYINMLPLKFMARDLGIQGEFFDNGESVKQFFLLDYKRQKKMPCDKCKGPLFILMDCYMPIKDGFQVAEELMSLMNQRKIANIPIIACTADESEIIEKKIKASGMKGCVHKPVTKIVFEDLLQKYTSTQQLLKQN